MEMETDFSSIHNGHERRVYEQVLGVAARYPTVAKDPELLADAACGSQLAETADRKSVV